MQYTLCMTKPKRDLYADAVPALEYYKILRKIPSLRKVTASQLGYRIQVPKDERRAVSEQVIQKEMLDYLRSRGAWCHKAKAVNLVSSGDGFVLASTDSGIPDILCCYRGQFIAIEVKAAKQGAQVSGEQVAQIEMVIQAGGIGKVCWSVEQVEAILDAVDKSLEVA